jgi:hypothetical protein
MAKVKVKGDARKNVTVKGAVPLQLNVTLGAPFLGADLEIKPYNWVTVHGQAGVAVDCDVATGGKIVNADGTELPSNPYTMKLDQNGFGSFRLAGVQPNANDAKRVPHKKLQVNVKAVAADNPSNSADGNTTFHFYREGPGAFEAYAYTTHAAADNRSPCTVYAVVDRNPPNENSINKLHVSLEGRSSATLQNSHDPKKNDYPLNPDGSVEIDIVDGTAENVKVTLYLPESANGDKLEPFEVQFVKFPL